MLRLRMVSCAAISAAMTSCTTNPVRMMTVPHVEDEPPRVRAFDLVPRGYDDNGFALNPRLGWDFNTHCPDQADPSERDRDPRGCSWRFVTAEDAANPGSRRRPCTTLLMDPDLSDDFSTGSLAITCSDSPLSFIGHVNWGQFHGGAVTYDGVLDWTEFSGYWPKDHDLNFDLALDLSRRMAETINSVHVEIDADELEDLRSPWWRRFVKAATDKHSPRKEIIELVGEHAEAQVTGLLGIDAEHMTALDMNIELHPAYAMAIKGPCKGCAKGVEDWAILVRTTGNEGLCSHWSREHSMAVMGGKHVIRLPWLGGKKSVAVDTCRTVICSQAEPAGPVLVRHDDDHQVVLVEVPLRNGDLIDGELYLDWADDPRQSGATCTQPPRPCRVVPVRDRSEKGIESDPELGACPKLTAPMSPARRSMLRPSQRLDADADRRGTTRRRAVKAD